MSGEIFTFGCASVDNHQGTMCAIAVPVFFCFSSVSFLGSIKQTIRDHVGLSISDRASDDWGVQRRGVFSYTNGAHAVLGPNSGAHVANNGGE